MKLQNNHYTKDTSVKKQRGSVIVITAICLIVLIGIGALAIDVGYLYATRAELQNVADAAALAGARYIGEEYLKLEPNQMSTHQFTKNEVYAVVEAVSTQNKAAKKSISIDINDLKIGNWDATEYTEDIGKRESDGSFTPDVENLTGPDAVRVIARRKDGINGAITTFFANIFNINTANLTSKKSIAALSGPKEVGEGELNTPFALSANQFPNDCTSVINFSPTASCAGWHNFFWNHNANDMEKKQLGIIEGDDKDYSDIGLISGSEWLSTNFGTNASAVVTPATEAGDEFDFNGGNVSSLFNGSYLDPNDYDGNTGTVLGNPQNKPAPITAMFDYFRYRDGDGDNSQWSATVPVYADIEGDCINPNNLVEVVGFARIVVFTTDPPPLSSLKVHVDCNMVVLEERGGGGIYGNLKGAIPNLVK